VHLSRDMVGDSAAYLQPEMVVDLTMYEGQALSIELPPRITATIETTEPVVKGQTASSSYKPAMLDNGIKTMVPPHIGPGTRVVISTEDNSYVERAKD
jgi:elongation factor P